MSFITPEIRFKSRNKSSNKPCKEAGSKTYKIFNEIGFSDIQINFYQPAITNKRLQQAAPMSAQSCKQQYIAFGLASESEINIMIDEIKKDIIDEDNSILGQCRMAQIYGKLSHES